MITKMFAAGEPWSKELGLVKMDINESIAPSELGLVQPRRRQWLDKLGVTELCFSAPSKLTLDAQTRTAVGINLDAELFSLCHGGVRADGSRPDYDEALQLDSIDLRDPIMQLVLSGGFMYHSTEGHVLQAKLFGTGLDTAPALQFGLRCDMEDALLDRVEKSGRQHL